MKNVITSNGLTIGFGDVRAVLDADGLPVWSGVVRLLFRDTIAKTVTKITANFSRDTLVDFEGDNEASDPIYEFCEMHAEIWARMILDKLGKPSYARAAA